MNYVSLFSSAGVGCFGFKQEGFQGVATSELIERRLNVQRANKKIKYDNGYILGDITEEGTKEKLYQAIEYYEKKESVKEIDVVVFTAPCQGMSVANHSVLNTKTNVPTANNAILWTVSGIWTDPDSGLEVPFSASINLTLVQLAKAAIIPYIYAKGGDFFRNGTPASLTINCDLYKDGALSAGSKKVKWFKADSTVTTAQDTDAGVGWAKITATSGTTGCFANSGFDTAVTTNAVLTVFPDVVVNAQTFLCVVTDNVGGTSGLKVKGYYTLADLDDPIMVIVDSSGGTIFKNATGSSTLTARLFRQGYEVDTAGSAYTYKWTKWENNAMDVNFGGTGINFKSVKTLTVGGADVNSTTTFKVEVSE